MAADLPENWEAFKEFLLRDDVQTSQKPLLPLLFRMYELGWQRKFPEEWVPLLKLERVRRFSQYEEICNLEERYGKYRGVRTTTAAAAAELQPKRKKLKVKPVVKQ